MGFFFTFLSMATHLQLSITNVGRRMLLINGTKWIFVCIILLMELFVRHLR